MLWFIIFTHLLHPYHFLLSDSFCPARVLLPPRTELLCGSRKELWRPELDGQTGAANILSYCVQTLWFNKFYSRKSRGPCLQGPQPGGSHDSWHCWPRSDLGSTQPTDGLLTARYIAFPGLWSILPTHGSLIALSLVLTSSHISIQHIWYPYKPEDTITQQLSHSRTKFWPELINQYKAALLLQHVPNAPPPPQKKKNKQKKLVGSKVRLV